MTAPQFINTDSEQIRAEIIAKYEEVSGRTLQPGQPEMLLINVFAYREKILREQIQSASVQQLISFASAPALDYLAELMGVTRLSASAASCTIQFTLTAGHGGVVIPANTRIATTDGQVNFAIQEAVSVGVGTNTATVTAFASVTGTSGNGYAIGTVTEILDPWPYVESATNTDATAGGADAESDEELRDRVKIAPAAFSVAGPRDAYKFFAKSASPDIIDVGVTSPVPGTVNVYPLVSGGIPTPAGTLTLVNDVLNDDKIRPLSDTVAVLSPTIINYTIEVDVTIYDTADSAEVQSAIEAALNAYKDQKAGTLGADIKLDQITALSVVDVTEVFEVTPTSPATDVVIAETEVAVCTGVTVNIIGTSNG